MGRKPHRCQTNGRTTSNSSTLCAGACSDRPRTLEFGASSKLSSNSLTSWQPILSKGKTGLGGRGRANRLDSGRRLRPRAVHGAARRRATVLRLAGACTGQLRIAMVARPSVHLGSPRTVDVESLVDDVCSDASKRCPMCGGHTWDTAPWSIFSRQPRSLARRDRRYCGRRAVRASHEILSAGGFDVRTRAPPRGFAGLRWVRSLSEQPNENRDLRRLRERHEVVGVTRLDGSDMGCSGASRVAESRLATA